MNGSIVRGLALLAIAASAVAACGSHHGADSGPVATAPPPSTPVDPPPAAPPVAKCDATTPAGGLSQAAAGGPVVFKSHGNWVVNVNKTTITLTHPNGHYTWEVWGDPHENLDGKHVKDWLSERRTLLMTDGSQITLWADGPMKVVHTVSLYDGAESHRIDTTTNTVTHSCLIAAEGTALEAAEYDGETARFVDQTDGALYVENIYNQLNGPDGPLDKVVSGVPIAEAGPWDTAPNRVDDYFN